MPTYPITDSPSQVSKSLTQSALVQNNGTVNIYLSAYTTVAPGNADMILSPGSAFTWPEGQDLWAATDAGQTALLSVLYNAEGSAVGSVVVNGPVTAEISGPVEADITGPVTVNAGSVFPISGTVGIGAPVNVQGGGNVLGIGSLSSAAPSVVIPAPSNGLTYYGIRCTFAIRAPTGTPTATYSADITVSTANGATYKTSVINYGGAAKITDPEYSAWSFFTIPMDGSYPITITVNVSNSLAQVGYTIYGVSTAFPSANTDLTLPLQQQAKNGGASIAMPASGTTALFLPPSFNPYEVRMYFGSTYNQAGTGWRYRELLGNTFADMIVQPHVSDNYLAPATAAALANNVAVFKVPGSGLAGSLTIAGSSTNAGSVFVTFNGVE